MPLLTELFHWADGFYKDAAPTVLKKCVTVMERGQLVRRLLAMVVATGGRAVRAPGEGCRREGAPVCDRLGKVRVPVV